MISKNEVNDLIKERIVVLSETLGCDQMTADQDESAVLGLGVNFNIFSANHDLKMVVHYTYGFANALKVIPPIFSMFIFGEKNKSLDFRSYLIDRKIRAPDNIDINRNNIDENIFINNYFDWLETAICSEIVPMFRGRGWIDIPFDWGNR